MSEWIEHDGKGIPVNGEALVNLRFRDGFPAFEEKACAASMMHSSTPDLSMWHHDNHRSDIVAYRIVDA